MCIVNAIRNCNGYETHQTVVGWNGKKFCPKESPYYFYKETANGLFLNLIDTDDIEYIPEIIINKTISFIDEKLIQDEKIFICCSLGESRSPSLALIYMLDKEIIEFNNCIEIFKNNYYTKYNPKKGYIDYIYKRFSS